MDTVHLLIASLLPPTGETGVQTHFRMFCEFAKLKQLKHVHIITPYATHKVIRGTLRRIVKLIKCYDREIEILYNRQFLYLFLRWQLSSHLNAHKPSKAVVYAQDPLSAKAALSLKNNGYPIEVVLVIHFNVSQALEVIERRVGCLEGRLYRNLLKLEQETIPRVDRLIFVSRFMEKTILERIPEASIVPRWIIPNMANDVKVPPNCKLMGDLITIGTIEPRKNQAFLVYVLEEIHRLGYRYCLTIIGDGECKDEMIKVVRRLGMSDYVNFSGYRTNAQELIHSYKVYVHAATMESFCLVLAEALACGKPVFAAPIGGISEVFDDGVEGFYWNLNDPADAAMRLIKVVEDDQLYMRMSRAARERYEANFKPEVVGPALLQAVMGNS